MGDFSRDPGLELRRSRSKGYLGVHVEQGVPVLDRDLNLLADLVAETVRERLARHVGDGLADGGDAFAVEASDGPNDLWISAPPGGGHCLVGGISVAIDRPVRYRAQAGVAPLSTPTDGPRTDIAYLDVWVEEVDATHDPELANGTDVGVQTSVRLRPEWRVRVAEASEVVPTAAAGHAHMALARLERAHAVDAVHPGMIVDLRPTGLCVADLARRIERIEAVLFTAAPSLTAPGAEPAGEASSMLRGDARPRDPARSAAATTQRETVR